MKSTSIAHLEMPDSGRALEGPQSEPEDPRVRSARWFKEGADVFEGQKQAAGAMHVDPGYLRRQLVGRKPVNLTHLELIRRVNARAFSRVVEAMALDASMLVIPRSELELSSGEARVLRESKEALGKMWPAYRDTIAAKVYRCTGDLIEVALEADLKFGK